MPSPSAITVSQLSRLIGTSAAPVLIDIRIDEDFNSDPRSIPGSFRHPFQSIDSLASTLVSKQVVIICHQGQKLSQGAAAILRDAGVNTEYLEGGHVAWTDNNQTLVSVAKLKNRDQNNRTIWVTRHRPKIDRIACPWLIKRFIDPNALFLYVEPSEVLAVSEKFNAASFDVEGGIYTHRGDKCTFDVMLDEFGLDTQPLQHLASIVRGADTGQHNLAPECAGLLAISLGFSRMYKDDLAQLVACIPSYDALYRWCRDARNEKHDRSMHTNKKV